MELKQTDKSCDVILNGKSIFEGTADDCYAWMRENKTGGRVVAKPRVPFDPPTLKELQEWLDAGFWKPDLSKVKL